uniref:Uncharacterized protein n=1 Tax=Anguilla anguilla TaxID=7936 RepID=A0A0E9XUP3_ANGAN
MWVKQKWKDFRKALSNVTLMHFMWRNIHPSITFLTYSVRLAKPWD